MTDFAQKLRRIWLLLIALIIVFFAFTVISPSGSWTCHQDFTARGQGLFNRSCLGLPTPGERVAQGAGGPLLILADPVYLSVFTPRAFSQAEITITYKAHLSSSTPIFETGFLADAKLWRYRLQPVYNQWLETGFSEWSVLNEGSLYLYQRELKYSSITEFLDAWRTGASICASRNCLAVYNVGLENYPPALDLKSLSQESSATVFPYAVRGAHQFYFYLSGQDLEISGHLFDRNNNVEKDDAELLIFSGQRLVDAVKITDERPEAELSGQDSQSQVVTISRSGLTPGLYRLEFRAGDDLTLADLRVNSPYLSVINKVWPDGAGSVKLITDGSYLQVKAIDPAVLQPVSFGGNRLELEEIYKQYEIKSRQGGLQTIDLQSGGILLENNAVFAAEAGKILNPDYPRLDRFAPLSNQLDYVFADYHKANHLEEGWLQSQVTFASGDFYREKNNYNLILSAPGMRLDSGVGGLIEIKEISIRFSGKNIWDKIRAMVNF